MHQTDWNYIGHEQEGNFRCAESMGYSYYPFVLASKRSRCAIDCYATAIVTARSHLTFRYCIRIPASNYEPYVFSPTPIMPSSSSSQWPLEINRNVHCSHHQSFVAHSDVRGAHKSTANRLHSWFSTHPPPIATIIWRVIRELNACNPSIGIGIFVTVDFIRTVA